MCNTIDCCLSIDADVVLYASRGQKLSKLPIEFL